VPFSGRPYGCVAPKTMAENAILAIASGWSRCCRIWLRLRSRSRATSLSGNVGRSTTSASRSSAGPICRLGTWSEIVAAS